MNNINTSPTGIARNGNECSSHTKYTAILAHGTPLNIIPSDEKVYSEELSNLGSFTIESGGAMVRARVTIDDSGSLFITRAGSSSPVMTVTGSVGDWQRTTDPTYWNGGMTRFLEAGTYTISAMVTNIHMDPFRNQLICRY